MTNIEKLQECMKDKDFVKELLAQDGKDAAQKFLENKGIELSMTELDEMEKIFAKIASGELSGETLEKASNGELSEKELEAAAGGIGPLTIALVSAAVIGGTGGTLFGLSEVFDWRW